ncbi:MAG: GtrA family protein [Verrucomicrobiota bacterium]
MSGILEQLTSHEAGPVVQFIKYAVGGAVATAVDIFVFYALSWKLIPALNDQDPLVRLLHLRITHVEEDLRSRRFVVNSACAFMFSNLTAYIINILWVFEAGRYAWWVELGLFYAVSGVSIFIGTFLGWALIRTLHLSTTYSYVTKGISALLINFVCRKYVIFKG